MILSVFLCGSMMFKGDKDKDKDRIPSSIFLKKSNIREKSFCRDLFGMEREAREFVLKLHLLNTKKLQTELTDATKV